MIILLADGEAVGSGTFAPALAASAAFAAFAAALDLNCPGCCCLPSLPSLPSCTPLLVGGVLLRASLRTRVDELDEWHVELCGVDEVEEEDESPSVEEAEEEEVRLLDIESIEEEGEGPPLLALAGAGEVAAAGAGPATGVRRGGRDTAADAPGAAADLEGVLLLLLATSAGQIMPSPPEGAAAPAAAPSASSKAAAKEPKSPFDILFPKSRSGSDGKCVGEV